MESSDAVGQSSTNPQGSEIQKQDMKQFEKEDSVDPYFTATPIVTSNSISQEIDIEGGELKINDCVITFPPGSFLKKANVIANLQIDSSQWPKGYIAITPMLYVREDAKLQKPASVKMTSWCRSDGLSGLHNTEVEILHLPDEKDTWEQIATLQLKDKSEFTFDCMDFSPVWAAIKAILFGSQVYSFQGGLYSSDNNCFTLIFHPSSNLIRNNISKEMKEDKRKKEILLIGLNCKINDKISVKFEIEENDGFSFVPRGDHTFEVKKSILKNQEDIRFNFSITHLGKKSKQLVIYCNVYKNDEISDRDKHCFTFSWTGEEDKEAISSSDADHVKALVQIKGVNIDRVNLEKSWRTEPGGTWRTEMPKPWSAKRIKIGTAGTSQPSSLKNMKEDYAGEGGENEGRVQSSDVPVGSRTDPLTEESKKFGKKQPGMGSSVHAGMAVVRNDGNVDRMQIDRSMIHHGNRITQVQFPTIFASVLVLLCALAFYYFLQLFDFNVD